jgi:hypothetical protein
VEEAGVEGDGVGGRRRGGAAPSGLVREVRGREREETARAGTGSDEKGDAAKGAWKVTIRMGRGMPRVSRVTPYTRGPA